MFETASLSQKVIDTKKPYDIAHSYAPRALSSYMRRFLSMSSQLPEKRMHIVRDFISLATYLSFTPNGTVRGIKLSELRKMFARKTEIGGDSLL